MSDFDQQKLKEANIGLYRDDGLVVVYKKNKHNMDRIRKRLYKIFNQLSLRTIINTNLKEANFLDINIISN